jgi:hypothetical protein
MTLYPILTPMLVAGIYEPNEGGNEQSDALTV